MPTFRYPDCGHDFPPPPAGGRTLADTVLAPATNTGRHLCNAARHVDGDAGIAASGTWHVRLQLP